MQDPFAEPADTRQAILGAAFRALCDHGYADLTISRIGEAFDKSPSLVYHHYDGKDDLLVDLLEFLLDGFEGSVGSDEFDLSGRARIDAYVSATLDPVSVDDGCTPDAEFIRVIVELRAQAASDDAYRTHFDRSDRVFNSFLETAVRDAAADLSGENGCGERTLRGSSDSGADSVTPEELAGTLQTLATGGMFRWATTTDRSWVGPTRAEVDRYVDATLPRVAAEDPE